jgi:hypothetical protein
VDGHVLEHALGIALEALAEGFGRIPDNSRGGRLYNTMRIYSTFAIMQFLR